MNTGTFFLEHWYPVTGSILIESSFSPVPWVPQLVCLVGLNPTCRAQSLVGTVVCSATVDVSDADLGGLKRHWTGAGAGARTTLKDECRREALERVGGRKGTVWRAANESFIRRNLRKEIQG